MDAFTTTQSYLEPLLQRPVANVGRQLRRHSHVEGNISSAIRTLTEQWRNSFRIPYHEGVSGTSTQGQNTSFGHGSSERRSDNSYKDPPSAPYLRFLSRPLMGHGLGQIQPLHSLRPPINQSALHLLSQSAVRH